MAGLKPTASQVHEYWLSKQWNAQACYFHAHFVKLAQSWCWKLQHKQLMDSGNYHQHEADDAAKEHAQIRGIAANDEAISFFPY